MLSNHSFQVLIAWSGLTGTAYGKQDPPTPASGTVLGVEKGENEGKRSGTRLRFTGGTRGE